MTTFADWLEARDSAALERAWTALAPVHNALGRAGWHLDGFGAAQLASSFLGVPLDRLHWLTRTGDALRDDATAPPPELVDRNAAEFCFVDDALDIRAACYEHWQLRELVIGDRGVQLLTVGYRLDEQSGDTGTVIRIFDRAAQRGASIYCGSQRVSTIGDVDLGPLDLFVHTATFRNAAWKTHDLATTRGLVAQLAAEIDAHYDVSSAWPGRIVDEQELLDVRRERVRITDHRFEADARAITITEQHHAEGSWDEWSWTHAAVEGLPWGHALAVDIHTKPSGTFGHVTVRLPLALGERVIARLTTIPSLELA